MAPHNWTAPHHTFPARQPGFSDRLLAAGADPNAKDRDGWTPLHHAVEFSGDVEIIQVLPATGAYHDIDHTLQVKILVLLTRSGISKPRP